MRQSHIALGAATFLLAACGGTTEERAATGGLGGAAAGAVVGGPVGAVVGAAAGATGGAVMDEGVEEKIGEATASEATPSQATANGADVLEQIQGSGQFSTFSQAVEATDLKDTLAGDGPFTVFAPTDAAFAQLPEGVVTSS
jgi:outer membrane lipoprotein SlyB